MLNLYNLQSISTALIIALPAIGVGIGQALISVAASDAFNRQPATINQLSRLYYMTLALSETAAIISLVITLLLLFSTPSAPSVAYLGIVAAIGLPGFIIGIASAFPAREALHAGARQPFFTAKIFNLLLITMIVIQTPIIFGFIIAFFIQLQLVYVTSVEEAIKLCMSGVAIGLGSIGPTIGLGIFARSACRAVGINRTIYPKLITFTFTSQALIETPILFTFIIALILALIPSVPASPLDTVLIICSALVISLSMLGCGISSGQTAATAGEQIAHNPDHYLVLSRASMLGQAFIDTSAVYGLIGALLFIFLR